MKLGRRVFVAAWLGGCAPPEDEPLPETEPVGEHLWFWAEPSAPEICEGTLPYMDAYVGELKRMHGSRDDLVVDYYWFPEDGDQAAEACYGSHASGCAYALDGSSRAIGRFVPMLHELVHAVRHASGASQFFFEEGAAELWGDHTSRFQDRLDVEAGIRSVASEQDLAFAYYSTAGQFAGFLVTKFGREFVAELAGETERFWSYERVVSYFEDTTGESLDALIDEFEQGDFDCDRLFYHDAEPMCRIAEPIDCSMANEFGNVEFTVDLSCGAPGVVGPRDGMVWKEYVVQPIDERFITISYEAEGVDRDTLDDYGQVTLERCGGIKCSDYVELHQIDEVSDGSDFGPDPALLRFTRYVDAPSNAFTEVDVFLSFGCPDEQ